MLAQEIILMRTLGGVSRELQLWGGFELLMATFSDVTSMVCEASENIKTPTRIRASRDVLLYISYCLSLLGTSSEALSFYENPLCT